MHQRIRFLPQMGLGDIRRDCLNVGPHVSDDDEEDEEDIIENSLGRTHLGEEDDIIESSLERPLDGGLLPHIADNGEMLENMVGRPHRQMVVVEDGEMIENTQGRDLLSYGGDEEALEPREGMEFDSEEAAKIFYNSYARRIGFSIRVSIYCRSKRDGTIISRRFVCSKEGFRRKRNANNESKMKRPRAITREGCKAMILVKKQTTGKWVLAKFERDHNHPLAPPGKVHCLRSHKGDKDKTIRELTLELDRVNHRCASYRAHLLMVLKDIEEQLSKKVDDIRQSIRAIESGDQSMLHFK
ncbi:protein FAR1-RELATED SEQUENCE 5-like [Aristolochia californica]|uniref:protein FAR1-RELATED SEQUENCE 5-like n=1 Tax=Aristolochia californica TaxID=171875 RepID=UPI0035DCEB55